MSSALPTPTPASGAVSFSSYEKLVIAVLAFLQFTIILDFVMPLMTAFDVLDQLKADPRTRGIPVIIATSKQLTPDERERLTRSTSAILSKDALSREVAMARIREALEKAVPATRA